MRKIFFIVALLLIMGISCSKEANLSLKKSIVGQWQFIYSIGGFTGNDTIKPAINETSMLFLNSNKTYKRTINGQIKTEGKYDIINIKTIFSDSPQAAIRFDNFSINDGLIIYLDEPNLGLGENQLEPYGHLYKRVK